MCECGVLWYCIVIGEGLVQCDGWYVDQYVCYCCVDCVGKYCFGVEVCVVIYVGQYDVGLCVFYQVVDCDCDVVVGCVVYCEVVFVFVMYVQWFVQVQ